MVGEAYFSETGGESGSRVVGGEAFGVVAKGSVGVIVGEHGGKKEKKSCPEEVEQASLFTMMKKIFLTIASVALLSNSNVWALGGGPFDNGEVGGLLMERGGFYQCQFSFRNGNGYGIFTPDSFLGGNLPNSSNTGSSSSQQTGVFNRGSLFTPTSGGALGHNANRSVLYYKGVSYVGGCFGFVDMHSRDVQGVCNGSSNETITQQTLSQNTGGLINASQSTATTQPLVINSEGNIFNIGWTGKVIDQRPNLRFRGKGELTVTQTGRDVKQLATTAYSGLLDAIVSSVSNSTTAPNYTAAEAAIGSALTNLQAILSGADTGIEPDLEKVRVTGNRRFF